MKEDEYLKDESCRIDCAYSALHVPGEKKRGRKIDFCKFSVVKNDSHSLATSNDVSEKKQESDKTAV